MCPLLRNIAQDKQDILCEVLKAYHTDLGGLEVCTLGGGHINDTYRVIDSTNRSYVLQRINGFVFPEPRAVIKNNAVLSDYFQTCSDTTLIFPAPYTTLNGEFHTCDHTGAVWRAQQYIDNSISHERVKNSDMAYEAGRCLGEFHRTVEQLPSTQMVETLPGFHDLPGYLRTFDLASSRFSDPRDEMIHNCYQSVTRFRYLGGFFNHAKEDGKVELRVTHGDPKLPNILFSRESNKAIAIIDFDTVGAGILLYDLGDFLRSVTCNVAEDDATGLIRCNLKLLEEALRGYSSMYELNAFERKSLFEALHLVTFELGVRFLSDYLQGNRYFFAQNERDNLNRATVQFDLASSIWEQQDEIRKITQSL